MSGSFFSTFLVMFDAIGRIFLIILVSGFLVRKKVISQDQVRAMSTVTINIFLPCMLFANIIKHFKPCSSQEWWMVPLSSVAMIALGLLLGYLLYPASFHRKQHLFPLASMPNAIYLVLPIGRFMYPGQFDQFAVFNFLYFIGFTPIVWSIGKVMITGRGFKSVRLRDFITPPLVAALGSVVVVFAGIDRYIPRLVLDSVELVGEATIPVSNIVLGATLGSISLKILPSFSDLIRINTIKYILLPVATLFVIHLIGLKYSFPILADMLVIEAAAAPATALIIQVRSYGGDSQTIGSLMLISYLICLVAIPFWISVWHLF